VGRSGNQSFYGLKGPANDVSHSSVRAVQDQKVFLVMQADFLPGNDRLSLYMSPTPGQPEPVTADVVKADLDLGSINDVVPFTPVPESWGWLLPALAVLLGLTRRWRPRAC
jgi:hypothetical protein